MVLLGVKGLGEDPAYDHIAALKLVIKLIEIVNAGLENVVAISILEFSHFTRHLLMPHTTFLITRFPFYITALLLYNRYVHTCP